MNLSLALNMQYRPIQSTLSASFSTVAPHDFAGGQVGAITIENASNQVVITPVTNAVGSGGGLFSVTAEGIVSFLLNGIDTTGADPTPVYSEIIVTVSDGLSTVSAVISVTVDAPMIAYLGPDPAPLGLSFSSGGDPEPGVTVLDAAALFDHADTISVIPDWPFFQVTGQQLEYVGDLVTTQTSGQFRLRGVDRLNRAAESGLIDFTITELIAPENIGLPTILGIPEIGQVLQSDPGSWNGAPVFSYQWLRGGIAIVGATASSYTLVSADDQALVSVRVTATENQLSNNAESLAIAPQYAEPTATPLPDQTFSQTTGIQTVDAAAAFSVAADPGGSSLAWSLATPISGLSINDATGLVSIDTDVTGVLATQIVTIRASNSGGSADSPFFLTVGVDLQEATIPASAFTALGDLTDPASYTLDGASRVSQWNDLSGNDNHSMQPNASFRPQVSIDTNGVPGLLMAGRSPDYEHLLIADAAIPRDTNVHVGIAFREAADQGGVVLGDLNQLQRPFSWWEDGGADGASVQFPARADLSEIHVNQIMVPPFDNSVTAGELGVAVHENDTAIILVRDLHLNTLTSGYSWQSLGLAALSNSSSTNAQYNLAGHIYGFVTFTDWADAEDALSWLQAQVQENQAPTASSPGLGFDVGAPS